MSSDSEFWIRGLPYLGFNSQGIASSRFLPPGYRLEIPGFVTLDIRLSFSKDLAEPPGFCLYNKVILKDCQVI